MNWGSALAIRSSCRVRAVERDLDYYQLLELSSTAATEAEIRTAYRRLARRYHPDVNPAVEAEDIFKALSQAINVLSDPERRRAYDEQRIFRATGVPWPDAVPGSGTDLHEILTITLKQAILGCKKRVKVGALRGCPECRGSGSSPGGRTERCMMCKGQGDIFKSTATATGRRTALVSCPACRGKGLNVLDHCSACMGDGLVRYARSLTVSVPPDVRDGDALRILGGGDANSVGGPNGDLFLHVKVLPDPILRRKGMDLMSDVEVPLYVALLGGCVIVNHCVHGACTLQVPAGTQHEAQLSLPRRGVLRKGSHVFTVRVKIPEVSGEQVPLLQRIAAIQES
jgi:molecular chaperone DnaJ